MASSDCAPSAREARSQRLGWRQSCHAQASCLPGRPGSVRCLRRRFPDADEAAFGDGVGRSLSTGDFLLLIVGDGIRQGAESLVAFLERYGHLRFWLALVEVAAYRLPDGLRLLQPRVPKSFLSPLSSALFMVWQRGASSPRPSAGCTFLHPQTHP